MRKYLFVLIVIAYARHVGTNHGYIFNFYFQILNFNISNIISINSINISIIMNSIICSNSNSTNIITSSALSSASAASASSSTSSSASVASASSSASTSSAASVTSASSSASARSSASPPSTSSSASLPSSRRQHPHQHHHQHQQHHQHQHHHGRAWCTIDWFAAVSECTIVYMRHNFKTLQNPMGNWLDILTWLEQLFETNKSMWPEMNRENIKSKCVMMADYVVNEKWFKCFWKRIVSGTWKTFIFIWKPDFK